MNVYLIGNVRWGFAPHLPTATLKAKNEPPFSKKIKKFFGQQKKPTELNQWAYRQYKNGQKNRDLQLFSHRSLNEQLRTLIVNNGDLHIFGSLKGEEMAQIGECFGESPFINLRIAIYFALLWII